MRCVLEKLIDTDNMSMRGVWESLDRYNPEPQYADKFLNVVVSASLGPRLHESKQLSQIKEEVAEIHSRATELVRRLEGSEYDVSVETLLTDEQLLRLLKGMGIKTEGPLRVPYIGRARDVPFSVLHCSVSDILRKFVTFIERCVPDEPILGQPDAENADTVYFRRRLSRHFQEQFNDPLDNVVAAVAATVFEREELDNPDRVRRLRMPKPLKRRAE